MEGILEVAVRFAFEKHEGQKRKGSIVPYIVHPVDVMNILLEMDGDTNLLVAGLLHDVVEDAGVTVSEIEQRFGKDVAEMVAGHSEDKSLTWKERKLEAIRETEQGDVRLKMLVLADKLSNLKSLYYDYKKCGEAVWNRFNAPKEMQAWYYSRMIDALAPLGGSEKTAPLYWELSGIFKDLFVTFFYEEQERLLYQKCISGENYCLSSNIPEWRLYTDDFHVDAVKIERKLAERIEDEWADEFYAVLMRDKQDGKYLIVSTVDKLVTAQVENGRLTISQEETLDRAERNCGKHSCKTIYELNELETSKFFYSMRKLYLPDVPIGKALALEFGSGASIGRFETFCKQAGIVFERTVL